MVTNCLLFSVLRKKRLLQVARIEWERLEGPQCIEPLPIASELTCYHVEGSPHGTLSGARALTVGHSFVAEAAYFTDQDFFYHQITSYCPNTAGKRFPKNTDLTNLIILVKQKRPRVRVEKEVRK